MDRIQSLKLMGKLFDLGRMADLLSDCSFKYSDYANKTEWVSVIFSALRAYSELSDVESKQKLFAEIKFGSANYPHCSDYNYVMGRILFEEKNIAEAERFFLKAKECAQNVEQKNNALFGLAVNKFYFGDYISTLGFLEQIETNNLDCDHLIAKQIWQSQANYSLGDYEQALTAIESAKIICQEDRNIYFQIKCFQVQIEIFNAQGNYKKSEELLQFASQLLPKEKGCSTAIKFFQLQNKIKEVTCRNGFELIESESRTLLKRPDNEIINLTKQEQLVLLLKKFMNKKEIGLSKEEISELLWQREYHPFEMDNKIYVTIKRLRNYLGESGRNTNFILQKNGKYMLNSEFGFTLFQHKYFDSTEKQQ